MKAWVELVVAVIDTKSGAETSAVVIKDYAALSAGIVPHEATPTTPPTVIDFPNPMIRPAEPLVQFPL